MSDNGTEFTTPVGRVVWGHPLKPQGKTNQQNQPVLNESGVQVTQWTFGLAIPRADFEAQVWPMMAAEAAKGYPQGFPPQFSWKYKDGDTAIDRQGKPYNQREGYAGHIVLTIATELQAPNVFKWEGSGYRQMQPDEIKTGDYVRVGLNMKVNIPKNTTHTPGIYVNPMAVEFVGYGPLIQTGFQADPNAMFGGGPVALPAGASATPVGGPAPVAMPGMGGAPTQAPQYAPPTPQQYAPPPPGNGYAPAGGGMSAPMMPNAGTAAPAPNVQPMQQQYAPPQPGQMPPPAHDFVQNAGMAPAPQGMPQQPQQYAPQPQGMPGAAPFPGAMPPR